MISPFPIDGADKAKTACFNSGHRIEDHFGEITEMIEIGKGDEELWQLLGCPVASSIWERCQNR